MERKTLISATINDGQNTQKYARHQKESKRGHQEIQPRNHTRHDHGIKEPDESPKNAEARPRQSDHTLRKAG